MKQFSKQHRLTWILTLILILCGYNLCESKIKECSGTNVKIEGDSLVITIDNLKGKAFKNNGIFYPKLFIKIYRNEDPRGYQHFNRKIELRPSKKYEFNDLKFTMSLNRLRDIFNHNYKEVREYPSREAKKLSYWKAGEDNLLNLCIELKEENPKWGKADDSRVLFNGELLIPAVDTKMSMKSVSAYAKEGFVYVNFNDVVIKNPDFQNFQLTAWFYDDKGNPLKDTNNNYSDRGGNVAFHKSFNELYDPDKIEKIETRKMPISELHLPRSSSSTGAKVKVKANVIDLTSDKRLPHNLECSLNIPPTIIKVGNIWAAGEWKTIFHLENLKIQNLYGENLKCVLSIYDSNKRPLRDTNNDYYLKGGVIGKEYDLGEIKTDNFVKEDYKLEIPTSEFHLDRDIDNQLFCRVELVNVNDGTSLFKSNYFPFEIKAKEKPKETTTSNNSSASSDNKKISDSNSSNNTVQKSTKTEKVHVHEPRQVWKERWNPCTACDPNRPGKCNLCHGQGGYYIGNIFNVCGSCGGTRACYLCGGRGQIMETYSVWE